MRTREVDSLLDEIKEYDKELTIKSIGNNCNLDTINESLNYMQQESVVTEKIMYTTPNDNHAGVRKRVKPYKRKSKG